MRVFERVAAAMVRKYLHSEEGTVWEQAEGNKMGILPLKNWENFVPRGLLIIVIKVRGALLYCIAFKRAD